MRTRQLYTIFTNTGIATLYEEQSRVAALAKKTDEMLRNSHNTRPRALSVGGSAAAMTHGAAQSTTVDMECVDLSGVLSDTSSDSEHDDGDAAMSSRTLRADIESLGNMSWSSSSSD